MSKCNVKFFILLAFGLCTHHSEEEVICHARAGFRFGFGLGSVTSRRLGLRRSRCNRSRCTFFLGLALRLRSLAFSFLALGSFILFCLPRRLLPFDFFRLPCGVIPLGILGFRLGWTCTLRCIVTCGSTDHTSPWLSPWMILRTVMSLWATVWLPDFVTSCTPIGLPSFSISSFAFSLARYFPFASIDIFIIR